MSHYIVELSQLVQNSGKKKTALDERLGHVVDQLQTLYATLCTGIKNKTLTLADFLIVGDFLLADVLVEYGTLMTQSMRRASLHPFLATPFPPHWIFTWLTQACGRVEMNHVQREYCAFGLLRCCKPLEMTDIMRAIMEANCHGETKTLPLALLVSLPDRISNAYGLHVPPRELTTPVFIPQLITVTLALTTTTTEEKQEPMEASRVVVTCALLSKLIFHGHVAAVAHALTQQGRLYPDHVYTIIVNLHSTSLKPALFHVLSVLGQTWDRDKAVEWLQSVFTSVLLRHGDNNVSQQHPYDAMIAQVLTHEYFMSLIGGGGNYVNELAASFILQTLYVVKPVLLVSLLARVAELWASEASVHATSQTTHAYLSDTILECLHYLAQTELTLDSCLTHLMNGVQLRLSSGVVSVRSLGMDVAEAFSQILCPNEPLTFDVTCNPHRIVTVPRWERSAVTTLSAPLEQEEDKTEEVEEGKQSDVVDPDAPWTGDVFDYEIGFLSDNDDENDLEPYALDDDRGDLREVPLPRYLGECLDYLRKTDAYDHWEAALEVCETLIRKMPAELDELGQPLLTQLVNVATRSAMNNTEEESYDRYENYRNLAMQALIVSTPHTTVLYLVDMFYGDSFGVSQRVNVLHVLRSAARELAGHSNDNTLVPGEAKEQSTPKHEDKLAAEYSSEPRRLALEESRALVAARIEQNTRRWGSAVMKPVPQTRAVTNVFGKVAKLFFLPLVAKLDRSPKIFNMFGSESIVLSELITTLGVFIQCSGFALDTLPLATVFLDILFYVRTHEHATVRRAALFGMLCVLVTIPPYILLRDLIQNVQEMGNWLVVVESKEMDVEARRMAHACLQHLQMLLSDNPHEVLARQAQAEMKAQEQTLKWQKDNVSLQGMPTVQIQSDVASIKTLLLPK